MAFNPEVFPDDKTIPLSEEEQKEIKESEEGHLVAVLEPPAEKWHRSPTATEEEIELETRKVTSSHYLEGGKTHMNRVEIVAFEGGSFGVVKKEKDQKSIRHTIEQGTGCFRDQFAYELDKELFGLVPRTVVGRIDGDLSSIQEYVYDYRMLWDLNKEEIQKLRPELQKLWIFDYLIKNSDRNHGNILEKDGKIIAIDNSTSLGSEEPLYVAFDYIGEKLSPEIIEKVHALRTNRQMLEILRGRLEKFLPSTNVDGFFNRLKYVDDLLQKHGMIPSSREMKKEFAKDPNLIKMEKKREKQRQKEDKLEPKKG